jgi:hypothetical protein
MSYRINFLMHQTSFATMLYFRGAQFFQKSRSYLKIIGIRRVIGSEKQSKNLSPP